MARLSRHHEVLTDGIGKCSVPVWIGGCPAGFCDEPAYGKQEEGQMRHGGWYRTPRVWFPGYCAGLACYAHGGPKAYETRSSDVSITKAHK